ncbi:hypothetical protein, partial [Enterococcus faecium]|uniref:hypothetical protein n=1 Tax=Enterococcus faecium TaxID=1352 RepID=UPI0019D71C6C
GNLLYFVFKFALSFLFPFHSVQAWVTVGHYCGMVLIPGPGTSACCGHNQKKKPKRQLYI